MDPGETLKKQGQIVRELARFEPAGQGGPKDT
jgi:hypothetical protein